MDSVTSLFRDLFIELNVASMKEYNDIKQRLMEIGIKNLYLFV